MRLKTQYKETHINAVFRIWIQGLKKGQNWEKTTAGNSLICSSLICSSRSNQLSDFEQFAQIAKDKWATVSESLRSHKTNEQFAQQIWLKKSKIFFFSMFYMRFLYKKMSDSLVSDVSKSLWSLTKNERTGAIRSGRSVEMSNCEQIAHFWAKNKQFARKTVEPSPEIITT